MSQGKADGKKEHKSQEKAVAAASKSSLASRLVEKKSKDDDDSDEDETDYSDEDETDDFDEGEGFLKKATMMIQVMRMIPPEAGKKRAAENALKTLLSDKKAKVATLSAQKTGGKKGTTHVATPYPAKQAGKTPANNDK
ncbi:unnamed protein product [Miscanthus lutarioriparius]|uniref:Uncharacterized protein n=1 Tax=Miscanthus lutarioriparius TaxID=422564 RepID=A0A811RLP4_9POAL|nr:unnamed protein product [Miscanthus lutarioriparius]